MESSRGKKSLRNTLWQLADTEKLRFTFRIFGHYANLGHYNLVARCWKPLRPNERGQTTLADLAQTHFPAVQHFLLRLKSRHISKRSLRDNIEQLPLELRRRGYIPAVWRMLIRARPRSATFLTHSILDFPQTSDHIEAINRFTRIKPEKLPYCTIRPIYKVHRLAGEAIVHTLSQEIRKRSRKGGIRRFAYELDQIIDMLRSADRQCKELPHNITWTGLKALNDEWHDWTRLKGASTKIHTWQPLLGNLKISGSTITELVDSDELFTEGQTMHHCVSSFDDYCAEGNTRIFHIEVPSTSGSTLELYFDGKQWHIGQHLTHCNQQPHAANSTIAKEVLQLARRKPLFNAANPPLAHTVIRTNRGETLPSPLDRYPNKPFPTGYRDLDDEDAQAF